MSRRLPKTRAGRCKRFGISPGCYKTLMQAPGYDPFRDAGDCTFSEDLACRAIDFFHSELKLTLGVSEERPFILMPWQQCIVANVWGWRRSDGTRRYTRVFIYIPKGNGKTPFAAGLMILVLVGDDELGAELYSVGYVKEQATLLFSHARGMVKANDSLSSMLRIFGGTGGGQQRSIQWEDRASFFRPLVADEDAADGTKPHFAALDELHRFKKRGIVDVLEAGIGKRGASSGERALIVYTTTADSERPSVCNEKLELAKRIRDGIFIDQSFLPMVYETPEDADWTDEKRVRAVNPGIGVTVDWPWLRDRIQEVKGMSAENKTKRYHLNMKTRTQRKWLALDRWDAGSGAEKGPAAWRVAMMERLAGRECYAGIDLSSKVALTALVLLFPRPMDDDPTDPGYVILPWFWVPRETAIEDERKHSIPYASWEAAGFLERTQGDVIDHRFIRKQVNELGERFVVREIAYDPWGATEMAVDLGPDGDGFQVIEVRQGFRSLSEPSKKFEVLIRAGKIEHGANPVLRWMISATEIGEDPAGNIKPIKPSRDSPQRIDGVTAAVTALARAIVGGGDGRSVYEEKELFRL